MNTHTTPQVVDAVTVEIIRNGLYAVTEEMKTNLTRTRLQPHHLRSAGLHGRPVHQGR